MGHASRVASALTRATAVIIVLAAVLVVVPAAAQADLWVSTTGTDTGYCSEANPCATISRAVSLAIPNDTIHVGPGTFHGNVTIDPSINDLFLQGAGMHATTVSGDFVGSGSVITVDQDTTAFITDMTITGGVAANGGGVNNAGSVLLERDAITLNRASSANPSTGGNGGGIYSTDPDAQSQLTIVDSEVTGNGATNAGGGIWAASVASPQINNDLISGNVVTDTTGGGADQGGGVWYEGDGSNPNGSLVGSNAMYEDTIVSNQIVSNAAGGLIVGQGGGVYSSHAWVLLEFDTLANNTSQYYGQAAGGDYSDSIISGTCQNAPTGSRYDIDDSYDVSDNPTCFGVDFGSSGDVYGEPLLGSLTNNGGPTRTLAIPASSPAFDIVPANRCLSVDQRGVPALQRGATACDAGAYQVAAPSTYVADPGATSVTAYAAGVAGDAAPVFTLSGSSTGLSRPTGVVTDVNGDVFVANAGNNSITEYAPETTGNRSPVATISGSATRLNQPQDVALDGAGHLFVTNLSGSVTSYPAGATGNITPTTRIAGQATLLNKPHGIVADPNGDLRVTNANGAVNTYAVTASGNVAPLSRLHNGALRNPQGVTFSPSGQMLVADAGLPRIFSFGGTATGIANPLNTLIGSPPLKQPAGLDVDQPGDVFVADSAANSIFEYAPGASQGATPAATISGPDTGLSAPAYLSELPPPPAPRLRLSGPKRRSRTQVLASGVAVTVHASGRMAFRAGVVRVSAVAHVRGVEVASARALPLRPGKVTIRLVPTKRAAKALRRRRRTSILVTVTVRGDAGTQTRRLTVTCTR